MLAYMYIEWLENDNNKCNIWNLDFICSRLGHAHFSECPARKLQNLYIYMFCGIAYHWLDKDDYEYVWIQHPYFIRIDSLHSIQARKTREGEVRIA